jgi:rhamnosyltransferase
MSWQVDLLKRFGRSPARVTLRLAEVIASMVFLSRPIQTLWSWSLARTEPPVPANGRYAVVAHVFYPDLWPEIVAVWSTLPAGSSLIVTVPSEKADGVRAVIQGVSLVEVHEYENRGRDLAPFISLLNAGLLDRFDAVLKIHTKKSPHLIKGGLRRKLLFSALAGSIGNVRRIIAHFDDPRVGMVGLAPLFRTSRPFWMGNRGNVERLCRRMQPNGEPVLGFFEGSMFWVRPAALTPIRSAALQTVEFDVEAGQLDGTLHHGLERVIGISVRAAGFDIVSIRGCKLMDGKRSGETSSAIHSIGDNKSTISAQFDV